MARPKNTDRPQQVMKPPMDETEIAENRKMKDFDLFLISVNRDYNDSGDPDSTSVDVRKLIRMVNTSQLSADSLNKTQDWRNKGQEGVPVIQWYFPAEHKVKAGMTLRAWDTFKMKLGKKVAIGLNIDSTKPYEG